MNLSGDVKEDLNNGSRRTDHWYRSKLGRALMQTERKYIARVLPDLFGYHILQFGAPCEEGFLESSRINHKIMTAGYRDESLAAPDMICDWHALPVASDSVDVVVMPHILEFDTHPHQTLREMGRVLIGDGHVVIIGFNPWSLWGLWRLFRAWRDQRPWNGKYISMARLRDWLGLLDFEVTITEYFYYRPPLENVHIMQKLGFMEQLGRYCWRYCGGIYLVAAKKRVIPMTPIKMQWQTRRHMLTAGVVEPGTRKVFFQRGERGV